MKKTYKGLLTLLCILTLCIGCSQKKYEDEEVASILNGTQASEKATKVYDFTLDTDKDIYHSIGISIWNSQLYTVSNKGFFYKGAPTTNMVPGTDKFPWYFYDVKTRKAIALCSDITCKHTNQKKCAAFFNDLDFKGGFRFYKDRLYTVCYDEQNGSGLISFDTQGYDMKTEIVITKDPTWKIKEWDICEGKLYVCLTQYSGEGYMYNLQILEIDVANVSSGKVIYEKVVDAYAMGNSNLTVSADHEIYFIEFVGETFEMDYKLIQYDAEKSTFKEVLDTTKMENWLSTSNLSGTNAESRYMRGNSIDDRYIYYTGNDKKGYAILERCNLETKEIENVYKCEATFYRINSWYVDDKYIYVFQMDNFSMAYYDDFNEAESPDEPKVFTLYAYDKETLERVYEYEFRLNGDNMDTAKQAEYDQKYASGSMSKAEYIYESFRLKAVGVQVMAIDDRVILLYITNEKYVTDDGSKDESGTGLITLDIDTIGTGEEKWEWISK